MASRRGNNEGSIYKMASGKWRAQYSASLGKRISFVGETQADCQLWLTELKSQSFNGISMIGGSQRLQDFLSSWLISVKQTRSRNTTRIYTEALLPVDEILGKMQLSEIRPDHIQATYNSLLSSERSAYSVKQLHKVLHVAFAFAAKLRMIDRNPVSDATPPKHRTKKMGFYDVSQVQALLFGAQASGDKYYSLYYLAINTGMRQGELLGLKWQDVDWDQSELSIERQLARYSDGSYEFTQPKSEKGTRKIAIGEDVLGLLRNHQSEQMDQSENNTSLNKHGLVFPSLSGSPVNASNLRRSFRRLLKFTRLPKIRFHDLRHTAATLMLNYGTPIPVVSQRLGHASVSMTLDNYAHAIPNKQSEAAKLMQSLLTQKESPSAHALHTNTK